MLFVYWACAGSIGSQTGKETTAHPYVTGTERLSLVYKVWILKVIKILHLLENCVVGRYKFMMHSHVTCWTQPMGYKENTFSNKVIWYVTTYKYWCFVVYSFLINGQQNSLKTRKENSLHSHQRKRNCLIHLYICLMFNHSVIR